MKRYINLIASTLLVSCSISITAHDIPTKQAIKDTWMKWANDNVDQQRDKFFDLYKINIAHFNQNEVMGEFIAAHDQDIEKEFSGCTSEESTSKSAIYAIASKIFLGNQYQKLEIVHNKELKDHVAVAIHYTDQKIFVTANCDILAQEDPTVIECVLRHEQSHIIHADTLISNLLQGLAFCSSDDKRENIEQNSYPFQKSYETRADIYSAINSADHGQGLISFLEKYAGHDSPHHPKDEDRIALLKKIKAELDAAS